jgi:hypothetical protein
MCVISSINMGEWIFKMHCRIILQHKVNDISIFVKWYQNVQIPTNFQVCNEMQSQG